MPARIKKSNEAEAIEEFEKAKDSASEAWDHFLEAREHMQTAALTAGLDVKNKAENQVNDTFDIFKDKNSEIIEKGNTYIKENPAKSAGLAFLGGLIFSRLIR